MPTQKISDTNNKTKKVTRKHDRSTQFRLSPIPQFHSPKKNPYSTLVLASLNSKTVNPNPGLDMESRGKTFCRLPHHKLTGVSGRIRASRAGITWQSIRMSRYTGPSPVQWQFPTGSGGQSSQWTQWE